jgi:ABC-type arginine transport system permease subunit
MKWQGHIPPVINVVIAISATLAGIIIALRFAPSTLAHENWSFASGTSSLSTVAIGVPTLFVVGLLFLKSPGGAAISKRARVARSLPGTFPDNVYFKDPDERG